MSEKVNLECVVDGIESVVNANKIVRHFWLPEVRKIHLEIRDAWKDCKLKENPET